MQQPKYMSSNQQTGYESFDEPASRLHTLLHETAWTTGSELLGELGLVIVAFEHLRPAASADLKRHLDTCLSLVKRVWPKIGK